MAKKVTITIDEGVLEDAGELADQRGLSLSAWISHCTRVVTYREALADAQAHRNHLRDTDPAYREWENRLQTHGEERARQFAAEKGQIKGAA